MRHLVALLCLPLGFLGLAFGLNIALGFAYVAVDTLGLDGVQQSLARLGGHFGPWSTGGAVAAALILAGFVFNFILMRFFGGGGFFSMFRGYLYAVAFAFIAFYLVLMGMGVYAGSLTPENSTLFFLIFQVPYALVFDSLGASVTGVILVVLGALIFLAALNSAAHGDEDDGYF